MDKSKKQQMIIEYLLSSPDTFTICKTILKSEYFNPEYRSTVKFLQEYHDKYNAIPSTDLVLAETDQEFHKRVVTKDEIEYCTTEIETFCRRKACEHAVEKASLLLNKNQPDQIESIIKDAVSVSLNKDTGSDYFQNVRSRLERLSKEPQRISTGWKELDEMLGGGLARSELILWSANSGGGKSITLANLAINFVLQNLNVLYITLELSSDMVEQRFDSMFTGIPTVNWLPNMDKIIDEVTDIGNGDVGILTVHRMPSGTTSNAIRGFLKEFELKHGYIPDLLVVDYLDAMGANEHVSADNVFEKDKRATEQLRDILIDYKMVGATASQQNRSAIDATDLNQSHIAGGISKVNTSDWYLSIVFNNSMRAMGDIIFLFLKSRSSDAVGKQVLLKWDNARLRILDSEKQKEIDVIEEKIASKSKNKSLLDIMDL